MKRCPGFAITEESWRRHVHGLYSAINRASTRDFIASRYRLKDLESEYFKKVEALRGELDASLRDLYPEGTLAVFNVIDYKEPQMGIILSVEKARINGELLRFGEHVSVPFDWVYIP